MICPYATNTDQKNILQVDYRVTRWDKDPYSLGAYSYMRKVDWCI